MIYLDYQATTPLALEAREAMLPWLEGGEQGFGNPHARTGWGDKRRPRSRSRASRSPRWCAERGRVVFTSGATEALNTALRGTKGDVVTLCH